MSTTSDESIESKLEGSSHANQSSNAISKIFKTRAKIYLNY